MALANKLYELRKNNNLSQEKLAQMLDVTRQTIANWESGFTFPNSEQLLQMSNLFKISIDELMDNKDYINDKNEVNSVKEINGKNKRIMILSFVTSFLFLLCSINMFIAWIFIHEVYEIALSGVFIGISAIWISVGLVYRRKYKTNE